MISETPIFREGFIDGVVVRPLWLFGDTRGWLVELFRHDELSPADYPAMAYISQTLAGVTRGPHEHHDQSDLFAFVDPGDLKLYVRDAWRESPTYGDRQTLVVGESRLAAVIVPSGVIHAYKNVSDYPGIGFNCPNRLNA